MDVSIIIINYNTFQLTSNCIRSIIGHTKGIAYEIILVDNASSECDPARFLKLFPEIKLIRSEMNGGFAYGNNLGIEQATGRNILLLNSDVELKEDSISKSLEYFSHYENAGVLGCRMTYADGTIQYSARRFRSIQWELLDLFRFIPFLLPYKKRSRLMLGKYFRHDESLECDWVNGAFFLFDRKILELLPGKKLDERFFMYGEDQFWCWQIKNGGYKIIFFAGTTIIHLHSGSADIRKQLANRKLMMDHELEIMRLRKGRAIYYFFFAMIFISKEKTRNFIKWIFLKLTGKLIR